MALSIRSSMRPSSALFEDVSGSWMIASISFRAAAAGQNGIDVVVGLAGGRVGGLVRRHLHLRHHDAPERERAL
jgi:hypothetical protein